MVCLCRPYPFKFFKGCPPQNLLSPLLNTLSQIIVEYNEGKVYRKLEYLLKIVSIFTLEIPGFWVKATWFIYIFSTTENIYFSSFHYQF